LDAPLADQLLLQLQLHLNLPQQLPQKQLKNQQPSLLHHQPPLFLLHHHQLQLLLPHHHHQLLPPFHPHLPPCCPPTFQLKSPALPTTLSNTVSTMPFPKSTKDTTKTATVTKKITINSDVTSLKETKKIKID
jgi:hypothetical protein